MLSYFWPDMKERSGEVELMDLTSSDQEKFNATLKQFKFINLLLSRSRHLIKKYIISDMLKNKSTKYTFLDIGSGGCDIAIWLCKQCMKKGIKIRITCIDRDIRAIRYSTEKCKNYKDINVMQLDTFDLDDLDDFDYIFSNHFLHHLPDDKIGEIIRIVDRKTIKRFLFNDISRSRLAFLGFTIFGSIFLHNSFSYFDGRLSIKKGFTMDEFRKYTISPSSIKVKKISPSRIYIINDIKV
jgi:2-polyprenyl-3-methyl-5-hydroxy-6-metoxy-1,4-benzoquinol methylase